jgi:hypothetical protein
VGKQWAATLVIGALLAGACSAAKAASDGESPGHPGVVLTTPTARPSPTTTATTVPAYSFDNSVPPPPLLNTGTDYVAIIKSLQAYGDWTTSHLPDPKLVDRFVARGTQLSSAYVKTLTILH